MNETEAIATFWTAWPTIQAGLVKAIAARDAAAYGDLPARISALVSAIDDRLQWELGPGERAAHCFTSSAAGDPELRVLAERWLASAPKDDPVFEHSAARKPRPSFAIQIEGHDVKPEDLLVRARTDDTRERIDVEVWHAAFASMPEDLRGTVTFLMLDGALGEDDVERWIGAVEPITSSRAPSPTRAIARSCSTRWSRARCSRASRPSRARPAGPRTLRCSTTRPGSGRTTSGEMGRLGCFAERWVLEHVIARVVEGPGPHPRGGARRGDRPRSLRALPVLR